MIIQEQSQKTKLWTIILQNINNIRDLKLEYEDTKNKIQSNIVIIFVKMLIRFIGSSLRRERLESCKVEIYIYIYIYI